MPGFNDTSDIRHRADGSIDVDYYLQQGRTQRSEAAHRLFRGPTSAPQRKKRGFFG